jgi:hypothetical protein
VAAVGGGGRVVEDHRRHGELLRHGRGDGEGFEIWGRWEIGEVGFGLCAARKRGGIGGAQLQDEGDSG